MITGVSGHDHRCAEDVFEQLVVLFDFSNDTRTQVEVFLAYLVFSHSLRTPPVASEVCRHAPGEHVALVGTVEGSIELLQHHTKTITSSCSAGGEHVEV
jgi:hypothetical protein